jgi:hypothetical protein
MGKRNIKPEVTSKRRVAKEDRARSNSVQEFIDLEPSPERQSRSRTKRTKRTRTPSVSSTSSSSGTDTTSASRRPSVLGDVRKIAYVNEKLKVRSSSPRYRPRRSTKARKLSPHAGPSQARGEGESSPRSARYSPIASSSSRHNVSRNESPPPDPRRNVSPFWGSQLDYEYRTPSESSSPVRDDPSTDPRDCIGHIFSQTDDLRRHIDANINTATFGSSLGPVTSGRRFRSRSWISGYRCTIKKLLVTQMEGMADEVDPVPWEGSPPDKNHFKEYDRIKATHCLLKGCTKAVYTEEMLFFPIMVRITLYCQGHVRILGSRYDHGRPVVGDIRPESVRVGCVLKAIRADFMRHTGLWDRGNIEAVALAFHPELFDQGQLLTDSGGIPGCPGPLTEPQRQEHRTSSEDIMEFMVELHRRRMQHNADRTRDDSLHPEERFKALHIPKAAAEMNKLCYNKCAPQCTIDLYARLYGEDPEVTPNDENANLMEEMDAVIQGTPPSATTGSPPEPVQPTQTPPPHIPGSHCVMVQAFLR